MTLIDIIGWAGSIAVVVAYWLISNGGTYLKTEFEQITEAQFAELFSDSPVKRTKFSGWKRNLKEIEK